MSILFFDLTALQIAPILSLITHMLIFCLLFLHTDYRSLLTGFMVEAAGIEPASKEEDNSKTTCLVSILISD